MRGAPIGSPTVQHSLRTQTRGLRRKQAEMGRGGFRPVTRLDHQGGEEFSARGPNFLNYAQ